MVIGRNEGARLLACLRSLQGQGGRIVYVDSGSTDNSVKAAQQLGVEVIVLDKTAPFSAARGRNAGFQALHYAGLPEYVQFVDGDCQVESGWIDKACAALDSDPGLGIVTGWRREIQPEKSVYNAICDVEWQRPAGEITTCGGDMMVRAVAFEQTGGFAASVIAAEDDEFCIRLRAKGWSMRRLAEVMTHHDADMLRFAQWWQRARRAGHGFAQIGQLHAPYFKREQRRVWLFAGILPVLALVGALTSKWLLLSVLALYGLSYLRGVRGLQSQGLPLLKALHHGLFLSLSKFPNILGMAQFHLRRRSKQTSRLIEYK